MTRTRTLFLLSSLVAAELMIAPPGEAGEPPSQTAKKTAKKSKKGAGKATAIAAVQPDAAPVPAVAKKEERCQINVQINNLRKNGDSYQGQLCYTLFRGSTGFPDKSDMAILNECKKVEQSASLQFTIEQLPCNQDYAIAVLHDENMNRQLDKNIAIPKEGVGMSNNPSFIRVNAPPYDNVKFMVQAPSTQQTIRIHYWP